MRKADYHGDQFAKNVSGCVEFIGEDVTEDNRKK